MSQKIPIEPNAIYTRAEAAHVLGTSLSTLKQLIRTGQLKVSQPAGMRRVFIRGTSILEMLDMSERVSGPSIDRFDRRIASDLQSAGTSYKNEIRPKQSHARANLPPAKKTAQASGGANR